MKKTILVLTIIFLIIMFSTYLFIKNTEVSNSKILKENKEYENYLDKEIYGTELVTLINKVIDKNEKNSIQKDEKNYYIENSTNSIKIEIKMLQTDLVYPMEEIYNKDITEFVKYFNLANFKCTKIEYHNESGKVSKMLFEEIINKSS